MEELQTLFDAGDSEGLAARGTELFRSGHEQAAFEYYRLASKLGNAVAMGNLGYCYQMGRGVKADNRLAAYCFERASELDEPNSMLKMGDFFFRGKGGLPKDCRRSVEYYLRAYEIVASSSEPDEALLAKICYRLGICKKDGFGTERDYEAAYEYFQAAAEAVTTNSDYRDVQAEKLLQKVQSAMAECETHF